MAYEEPNESQKQHRKCSVKKGALKKFLKIHRKTPVPESLFK